MSVPRDAWDDLEREVGEPAPCVYVFCGERHRPSWLWERVKDAGAVIGIALLIWWALRGLEALAGVIA